MAIQPNRMKRAELLTYLHKPVQWERSHDEMRGQFFISRGVLRDVCNRQVLLDTGDWISAATLIGLKEIENPSPAWLNRAKKPTKEPTS